MATTNPITGDLLVSKTLSEKGSENYDAIFGKKKKTNGGWTPPPLNLDKLEWTEDQDPESWGDSRVDIIGQNGNTGEHYDATSESTD
jgi:hypothetical protein